MESQDWFQETLHAHIRQSFRMSNVLFREKSEFQDVVIFENDTYGRVLALDGIIQLTERDEFIYHEMMAHVPLCAHINPKRVLVVGGGDGGIVRECLRHPSLEKVTLVELDSTVVDLCKKHMPMVSAGCFENPRLELIYQDGCKFVKQTKDKFDVIIIDSSDPVGPSAVLFAEEFYKDCFDLLSDEGILVTQNGVPFLQTSELTNSVERFRSVGFIDTGCFLIALPTYYGGFSSSGWASKSMNNRNRSLAEIEKRYKVITGSKTKYYTPAVGKAAFALPPYIEQAFPVKA